MVLDEEEANKLVRSMSSILNEGMSMEKNE